VRKIRDSSEDELIASTRHRSGLSVCARLDEGRSPAQVTVSAAELTAVNLHGPAFHPRQV
jgi:hypothetical protein